MLNAIEIMKHSKHVITNYDSNVSRFMKIHFVCSVHCINHTNEIDFTIPVKNPAYSF
jgi:tagatose-1,6-bisphosphate aldolase non-catalytic subunit AgaZ/GatZ